MTATIKAGIFLGILSSVAIFGCGDGNKAESTTDSLTTKVENGMDNLGNKIDTMMNKNADEDFLSDAVEANTMEMRALLAGKQKGGKDVKTHAGHMLADHKALGEKVQAYISSKNIKIEDVDTTDTDNDLNDKTGADFDKAWADKMVNDHEHVISMFEDAQDDVKDPELKTMITGAIPKLKSHLEMAKQLQDKLNNAKK